MNNPQFYIFGVPDGFDMYNATPERLNLFQLLYDSDCQDKRKMAIYRSADNSEVSYIYLRYNMQSVKGRSNSFLGMSLTFTNRYYCKDIQRLLNLFEEIYSALSKDVVLTTRINPSVGQARYRIGRFAEATAAIIKIEEFVEEQTRTWFGNCVVPIDDTFRLNTQSVSLKQGLYLDTKSEHIIANLKTASWVYLSENVSSKKDTDTGQPQNPPTQPKPQEPQEPKPSIRPDDPDKQPPATPPSVDPRVVAEQERQKKQLKELDREFNAVHNSLFDKKSKNHLSQKKEKLQGIQQQLSNLQYAYATKEGNSLAVQIGSDINRIDEQLQNIRKKTIMLSVVASVVALIALLVAFWPSQTQTIIDKSEYESFVNESESRINEINDTLNNSLTFSDDENYREAKKYLDSTKTHTIELKNLLSKDRIDTIQAKDHKQKAESYIQKLNESYNAFLNKKKETQANVGQTDKSPTKEEDPKKVNENPKSSSVEPTENNVAININGKSQTPKSNENGVYKYDYTTSAESIKFELQNGHTAKWTVTGTGLSAANNESTSFTISIKESTNGKVTATINDFNIKLEIIVRRT